MGDDDIFNSNHSDIGDGIVTTTASLSHLLSDNHFIKEKQNSSITQKQWLRKSLSAMDVSQVRSPNTKSFEDTVHIHQGSKSGSEMDWTDCNEKIKIKIKKRENTARKRLYFRIGPM